jgi:type II restriction enzyme
MGYVMIVHDCPDSRIVGRGVRSAHFPIDPDFEGASYLDRFLLLCDRLRRKSLYQAVWLVFANPEDGVAYEPSTLLSYDKFIANIVMALGVHRA